MKTKKIYYLLCLNYLSYIQNSSPSSMRHTKGWFIFRYTLLFCLIKAAGVFFFVIVLMTFLLILTLSGRKMIVI